MKTETKAQCFMPRILLLLLGGVLFAQTSAVWATVPPAAPTWADASKAVADKATRTDDDPPRFAAVSGNKAPVVLRPGAAPAAAPANACVACGFGADDANKVSQLELQYTGPGGHVQVYNNDDASQLAFDSDDAGGDLTTDDVFTVSASTVGRTEFSSKIGIYVDGSKVAELHTSCSAAIGFGTTEQNQEKGEDPNPGDPADILVLSGIDKDSVPLCEIPPPSPSPGCLECKGGVTQLTLEYTGEDPITVNVYNDKDEKAEDLLTTPSLSLIKGSVFTIAKPAGDDKLSGDVSIWTTDGLKLTNIHTSCSQAIGPGAFFGQFKVVESFSKDNGEVCPVPECLECKGGVTMLTLLYTGDVALSDVVVYNDKNDDDDKVLSGIPSTIMPDQSITIVKPAGDDKLNGDVSIWHDTDGDGVAEKLVNIHTSCSQPIGPGAMWSQFKVVESFSKDNGKVCPLPECLECKGGVTMLTLKYNGTDNVTVNVYNDKDEKDLLDSFSLTQGEEFFIEKPLGDDKLNGDISIWAGGEKLTEIHTSCSQPIGTGAVFGLFSVVDSYSKDNGNICPVPDCLECKGGVTSLTLMYNGDPGDDIVIEADNVTYTEGHPVFGFTRDANGEFTIIGTKDDGKFEKNDLEFFVNGDLAATFHVSCSQTIGPGTTKGDFTVTAAISKDNGNVCPVPECVLCGFGEDNANKVGRLTLSYMGPIGNVQVYNNDDVSPDKLLFDSATDPAFMRPLGPGDLFEIRAEDIGKSEFSSKIGVYVGSMPVAVIHTSCSAPLIPGTTTEANQEKGENPNGGDPDILVVGGADKDGVPLCDSDGKIPPEPGPDCPNDPGPPVVEYAIDESGPGNPAVVITVTDNSKITDITVNGVSITADPKPEPANLEFVSTTFVDFPPEATAEIRYRIVDLTKNATILIEARDDCDLIACETEDEAPTIVSVFPQGVTNPPFIHADYVINSGCHPPFTCSGATVGPDGLRDRFGRDLKITDDVGVRRILAFALNNTFVCRTFEGSLPTGIGDGSAGPSPGGPPGTPGTTPGPFTCSDSLPVPFGEVFSKDFDSPLKGTPFHLIGAVAAPFQDLDGVPGFDGGTIAALAADECNAFIFDPPVDGASKRGAAQGGMPGGMGTGAPTAAAEIPVEFALEPNYPNPFNPATQIGFALPEASDVRLVVYDMLGRVVRVLADGHYAAGRYTVAFDAQDLASGMYIYRIEAGRHTAVRQMTLMK